MDIIKLVSFFNSIFYFNILTMFTIQTAVTIVTAGLAQAFLVLLITWLFGVPL